MDLKGRHFLTLKDYTPEEILYLLDLAAELKQLKRAGKPHLRHPGKNVALIFEKTSTRTRCSFEVAAYDMGMNVTYLDPSASQIGKKESIRDTARVLGRMYDGIGDIGDARDREIFQRAGGGLVCGVGQSRGAALLDDDAVRACTFRRADDGAEVVRILDLVEDDDEGRLITLFRQL